MNMINLFSALPPRRSVHSSSFPSSSWKHISPKDKVAVFITSRLNPRTTLFSVINHCSAKPNTNINSSNSEQNQNPPANGPNPRTESQPLSDRNPSISPSPPSSSSSQSSSHTRGLILDLGRGSSWDSSEVGSPVVKRFLSDEEERWYMWYHGRSGEHLGGCDSIGLAVSSNGAHWERVIQSREHAGLVMRCSDDWWAFDTAGIRPCDVVVMSSSKVRASSAVYWLYYTGYNSEKVKYSENSSCLDLENPERVPGNAMNSDKGSVLRSLPGLAISQDGRHWARIEGDHHSGALFDVGAENEWDSLFVSAPRVVFHRSGDLRMYYHSFDKETGEFCIGMARSRDGIKWVKLGKVLGGRRGCFDECGVVNAHVVRNGKDGKYLMVYEGVDMKGERSIGFAVSNDGLKEWRRLKEEPIFRPSEAKDSWDSRGVGSPYLVQLDGEESEWRLYYRGVGNGGGSGIGMAVCEGAEIGNFIRWTGFQI
ncbi:hypothetical protein SAY86_002648 [Trapa natans]|uniref:Glycosyl hydrolase, five-bladed beta-propellor domain-containing protein n=1 Tax=Trapa natans TaxID=22666 RepID=A0AAN7QZS2_TRANT|nr:hypothetical protein SAY86_002648 [Trapa natans]